MWGNEKEDGASGTVDTLIGRQTEVQGDVRFAGGLHIDGKIKGKVLADSDKSAVLSVSESGEIEGDVRVPNIVLNGIVEGDVHATQRITLSAKAKVTGNVYYSLIEIVSGATINGQLVHEGDGEVAALPHQKGSSASSNSSSASKSSKPGSSDTVVSGTMTETTV